MENIFNFTSLSSQNTIQQDFSLIHKLLVDLPDALNYFIDKGTCNLLELLDKRYIEYNKEEFSTLFQRSYNEAFYEYDYFLADVEQKIFGNSEVKDFNQKKELHVALKKNGLTGNSLKLKLNMLHTWWEKLKMNIKANFVDFKNPKTSGIFRKLLACLNSILGSLTKIFAALEPIKEFKEMLESGNDLVEEVN